MIDSLMSAVRFDFAALIKRKGQSISTSLCLFIVLSFLCVTLLIFYQYNKLDVRSAVLILQRQTYSIDMQSGLSLNDGEINSLNSELASTGFRINGKSVQLGNNELIPFAQILMLTSKESLSSKEINKKIINSPDFYSHFLLFYLYFKEGLIIPWFIVLGIALARITQKNLLKINYYSYQCVYGWVSLLFIDPLILYLFLSIIDVRWSYKIFLFTVVYTLISFSFSKYVVKYSTISGEKNANDS